MDQPIQPTQVDKQPEIGDLAEPPGAHLALRKFLQQILATRSAPFFGRSLLGKDKPLAAAVNLDDF